MLKLTHFLTSISFILEVAWFFFVNFKSKRRIVFVSYYEMKFKVICVPTIRRGNAM